MNQQAYPSVQMPNSQWWIHQGKIYNWSPAVKLFLCEFSPAAGYSTDFQQNYWLVPGGCHLLPGPLAHHSAPSYQQGSVRTRPLQFAPSDLSWWELSYWYPPCPGSQRGTLPLIPLPGRTKWNFTSQKTKMVGTFTDSSNPNLNILPQAHMQSTHNHQLQKKNKVLPWTQFLAKPCLPHLSETENLLLEFWLVICVSDH